MPGETWGGLDMGVVPKARVIRRSIIWEGTDSNNFFFYAPLRCPE